nr:L-histidine N(alpha)-methyltransferase [Legionella sp. PL877]
MQDVFIGLSKKNKQIQSKYFYDAAGSELFNQITRHPDYYLTQCELEILTAYKQTFSTLLSNTQPFNLVELGPGEGIKTRILLNQFLEDQLSFTYYTIDISRSYLINLVKQLQQQLPQIDMVALNSDYLGGLEWLGLNSNQRNFVLFLGSSIGNFDLAASKEFLRNLRASLRKGDYLLIGFDLLKDIDVLMRAYNDRDGITRRFNLNLLKRINYELNANFNIDSFYHYGTYNAYNRAMESYLISRKEQIVSIKALNKSFNFKAFEPIHVESSYKYLFPQIKKLADISQFNIIENYTDSNEYFVNSLWQVPN